MNRLALSMLIVGFALALTGPVVAGDVEEAALLRKMTDEKSPSIVSVKFVMKIHWTRGVQEGDQEVEREVSGVVVSADGLIMINNAELDPRSNVRGVTIAGNPVDFKVMFPGDDDEEEYEAVLAAMDSNLGLAFVVLKDAKAHALSPIQFEGGAKLELAQELIGVARLPRGFDFAPFFGTVRVTAKIAKPRKMWLTAGTFSAPASVLFDRTGAAVGVMTLQEAASGGGRGIFVLPADVIKATITQASESAKQVLADVKEGDASGTGETKPAEGDEPDDGDDPDGDDGESDGDDGEVDDGGE